MEFAGERGQQDFTRFVRLVYQTAKGGKVDTSAFTQLGVRQLHPIPEAEQEPGTPAGHLASLFGAQGPNANGGAREYFKDGLLTEGFALIAWPADYGASGVMTFIVNQDGVVFQKDLGEETATAVEAIQSFDPDSSWTAIAPPEETPAG